MIYWGEGQNNDHWQLQLQSYAGVQLDSLGVSLLSVSHCHMHSHTAMSPEHVVTLITITSHSRCVSSIVLNCFELVLLVWIILLFEILNYNKQIQSKAGRVSEVA